MVDFRTHKETVDDRVVAALNKLYNGKPVGSKAIGKIVGMEHRQTLKYLHRAKDDGLAKPIESSPGGIIRGWVPGHVEFTESMAEQKGRRAAAAVAELANGKPVRTTSVAKHLNVPDATVGRWLKTAETMKLVKSKPKKGWTIV